MKAARAVFAVVWMAAVAGAYYWYNAPYYHEKLRVFGAFFLGAR